MNLFQRKPTNDPSKQIINEDLLLEKKIEDENLLLLNELKVVQEKIKTFKSHHRVPNPLDSKYPFIGYGENGIDIENYSMVKLLELDSLHDLDRIKHNLATSHNKSNSNCRRYMIATVLNWIIRGDISPQITGCTIDGYKPHDASVEFWTGIEAYAHDMVKHFIYITRKNGEYKSLLNREKELKEKLGIDQ